MIFHRVDNRYAMRALPDDVALFIMEMESGEYLRDVRPFVGGVLLGKVVADDGSEWLNNVEVYEEAIEYRLSAYGSVQDYLNGLTFINRVENDINDQLLPYEEWAEGRREVLYWRPWIVGALLVLAIVLGIALAIFLVASGIIKQP